MIPYPIHVAILLAVCLLFYKLLLQNQTYYKLNRWILLACMLLAFILPMIQIPQAISFRSAQPVQDNNVTTPSNAIQDLAKTTVATSSVNGKEIALQTTQSAQSRSLLVQPNTLAQLNKANVLKWAMWMYWAGCVVFAANFLLQIIVLFHQAYKKPVIRDGSYRIIEIDEDRAPCSFGNNIFINPTKYDWETYQQILLHEKVHIQQRHTLDLILAELMLMLQWFNPFAWYYRKEIENNLEFLTDDSIISHHKVAAEAYQLSLLKVSVPNYAMHITTNYNQSLLKRRILMMNAKQSNIHTSWKYFMLMPVLAVLVCGLNQQAASSGPVAKSKNEKTSHQPESKALLITAPKPSGDVANTAKHIAPATLPGADTDMQDDLSTKPDDLNLTTFIQDNAELIKHGEFKKVLERHIWYHNHALEYNPGLVGVRLSFVLSDWKKLADMYPPALRAMQKIRDSKTKDVTRNSSSVLFIDVAALNRTLDEDSKTVDLFKILDAKQPETAAACFQQAKPALFAANQYSTISKYLGDPVKEFDVILNMYNTMGKLNSLAAPNENANFKAMRDSTVHKVMTNNLVTRSVELIKYTVAINDMKSAREIQKKALALVKDDRLNHALDH